MLGKYIVNAMECESSHLEPKRYLFPFSADAAWPAEIPHFFVSNFMDSDVRIVKISDTRVKDMT